MIANRSEQVRYPEDCERIRSVVSSFTHGEMDLKPRQCEIAWGAYSESMAATWIILPDSDKELFESVEYFLRLTRELPLRFISYRSGRVYKSSDKGYTIRRHINPVRYRCYCNGHFIGSTFDLRGEKGAIAFCRDYDKLKETINERTEKSV